MQSCSSKNQERGLGIDRLRRFAQGEIKRLNICLMMNLGVYPWFLEK